MTHQDHEGYWRFTGPQRLHKALVSLGGLVEGLAADGVITPDETRSFSEWMRSNADLLRKHPFCEIVDVLELVIGKEVSGDALDDLLYLVNHYTRPNLYFDQITSDMQKLQGRLAGIAFDKVISAEELREVQRWLDETRHLASVWPYHELSVLISEVLADGEVSREEHDTLLRFFSEFHSTFGHRVVGSDQSKSPPNLIVCAPDPELTFPDMTYCFTGTCTNGTRKSLQDRTTNVGAKVSANVTIATDFVVLGAEGNASWAFSCYGRKVELAIKLREENGRPILVHENDFYDALQDAEAGVV